VAKAVVACLSDRLRSNAGVMILNVGDRELNYRKIDVARAVAEAIDGSRVVEGSQDHDPRSYRVSFRAIRDQLGFAATRTLQNGIEEVSHVLHDGVLVDPWSPTLQNH
jgi:nucleoside-diphosphate-sugar epimerase